MSLLPRLQGGILRLFWVLFLILNGVRALAGPERGPGAADFPQVQLPSIARGRDAIQSLGEFLPAVARAYGTTAAELHFRLLTDDSLAVDPRGRLHFTDGTLADTSPDELLPEIVDQTISTADALRLHSRPGSKRTLFLDFGGEVMSNNAWTDNYNGGQSIVAPAYDIDGDPTTFNETERAKIIEVWERVAEDYAPFDVDVCTELASESLLTRSGSNDDIYGLRVLFSPISSYVGNYGGVSYVGTFNEVGDYWKPSLVFTDTLGASNAKKLAEAASHEAGHALGLSHDGISGGSTYYTGHGSGETSWAPIMGVGYSRNVTQWSRGEYSSPSNTENDLLVIQAFGLNYRPDDHGNAPSSASYIAPAAQLGATGLIEQGSDTDVFAISAGAGLLSVTVSPQATGPNLDVRIQLLNASGSVLATAAPDATLAAGISLEVAEGTYFVAVSSSGAPAPPSSGYTTYGSLGQYTLTGTATLPSQSTPPVAVADASAVSGAAPLAVTLNGGNSFDPDGVIAGYAWNFGDGTTAAGSTVAHSYAGAGSYAAVLTVTDNTGLSQSDTVIINVSAINVAPVAAISTSTTSGTAPLSVGFNGSASSDADGQVVSWFWDFGDGTTGSGPTISHSYSAAGTYVARLTVTDNSGGVSSATASITVTPAVERVLRVESIVLTVSKTATGNVGRARIRVTDPAGNPVTGVTVSGAWSGALTGTKSGKTGTGGYATLSSKSFAASGTLTFTVNRLTLTGYTYNPSLNLQTSASVPVTWP